MVPLGETLLEHGGGAHDLQPPRVNDGNAVPEDVSLVHVVRGEHDGAAL